MTTVILGGGLTGLTLGRLLREKRENIIILEKENEIGGLCRSVQEEGFTFDTGGSHIIFSRDSEVAEFMQDVLGENRGERNRNTKIFFRDRYVKYPFENGLADLLPEDRFRCLNEFVKTLVEDARNGGVKTPDSFREWIYSTFGAGIAELYMIPYNEKIWNYPAEKMSAHWMEGRVPRPPVEDIIKSAIGIETEGYTHQSVFSYPVEGGIAAMVEAIAAPALSYLKTGFAVTSVKKKGGKFHISNGIETIIADRCISTIPLEYLLSSMDDVPHGVRDACDNLRYNSIVCVNIGVKADLPPYSWVYIPETEIGPFNRISFPSGYSTETAPPGHSSILAEITFNEGDAISGMTDEEAYRSVSEGLGKMGLLSGKDEIVYWSVHRHKYAYVVYDREYRKNIAMVRDFCSRRGIDLLGRFSEFEYLNMDGCIRHVFDYVRKLYPNE